MFYLHISLLLSFHSLNLVAYAMRTDTSGLQYRLCSLFHLSVKKLSSFPSGLPQRYIFKNDLSEDGRIA
jgi:hypothetical protein